MRGSFPAYEVTLNKGLCACRAIGNVAVVVLLACWLVTGIAADKSTRRNAFEKEMFAPGVFASFGIDRERVDTLSARQREDLLSARRVLLRFLRVSRLHEPDIRRMVDASLLSRFPDQAAMLQTLFGQEAEVLIGAVTDFTIRSSGEIELGYYVVLFAEGRMILRDDKALMKRSGGDWVIARIGGLQ